MEPIVSFKVRLFDLLNARRRPTRVFMQEDDPETGTRWWQAPRTRNGDLWIALPSRITHVRDRGEWHLVGPLQQFDPTNES